MQPAAPRRLGWPRTLERRLPLMFGALLVTVLAVFSALAFQEVEQAARDGATERMKGVAKVSVRSVENALSRNFSNLLPIITHANVVAAMNGGTFAPDDSLHRALGRRGQDTTLVAQELLTARGQAVWLAGSGSADPDQIHAPQLRRMLDRIGGDSIYIGSQYRVGERMHYWVALPIRKGDTTVGYYAERRITSPNPQTETTLRDLTGEDIDAIYASRINSTWRRVFTGETFDAPVVLDSTEGTFTTVVDGQEVFGHYQAVPNSDWLLILTVPKASTVAHAGVLLTRSLPFALALLLVGGAATWMVSRNVTKPIKELVNAANDVASGDYARRVHAPDEEELAQLANAFNRMAERVGESHHQLAERNGELQAERALAEAARSQAQQANEAKTSFLAMMSHELRTPLSAIGGYTEILQLGLRGDLNEAQLTDLERIRSNQEHLLTIINDMLDLSQIEAGQLSVTCEPVAMSDVLERVEAIVAPQVSAKKLQYVVDETVRTLSVQADRERLRQVLVNLISNATRFSESGGVIQVNGTRKGDRVYISVSDTGIGIPVEKIDAIFEPFVQVDSGPTRRSGGTGLGLPISRRLAIAMSGSLTATSEVGVGSVFTLELPAGTTTITGRPDLRLVHGAKKAIA